MKTRTLFMQPQSNMSHYYLLFLSQAFCSLAVFLTHTFVKPLIIFLTFSLAGLEKHRRFQRDRRGEGEKVFATDRVGVKRQRKW